MFAAEIRRERGEAMRVHRLWQWHLDVIYVKINGVAHYLWRAASVDASVHNHFPTEHHLRDRSTDKQSRAAALAERRGLRAA